MTHAVVTTTHPAPSILAQVAATPGGDSGLLHVVFGSPPPLYDETNLQNEMAEVNHSQRVADLLLPPSYDEVGQGPPDLKKDPTPLPPSCEDVERGSFVQITPAYSSL